MTDPYRVLGVSPDATDDEIKKAYRALAKKYHPDVNNGSSQAEARMKEVNEAYSAVMKMRREGASGGFSGYDTGYGSGFGGYGGGFGGYGDGFGGYGYGGGARSDAGANPHLRSARTYIQAGHFQEAMNVLEGVMERGAEWYYLCGEASLGLGNRVAALNYARQAVSMDPNSLEYRLLLSRLEGGAQFYRQNGNGWGFAGPSMLCGLPGLGSCIATGLLSMLCCSRGWGGWLCC